VSKACRTCGEADATDQSFLAAESKTVERHAPEATSVQDQQLRAFRTDQDPLPGPGLRHV
jgi:hypothetical protein